MRGERGVVGIFSGGREPADSTPELERRRLRKLSHPLAHSVKHLGLRLRQTPLNERAGRRLVAAAANERATRAVDARRAAAKAKLKAAGRLLDKNDGHLDALDGQGEVDHVFGVGSHTAGRFKIRTNRRRIGQPPVEIGPRAFQNPGPQPQPGQCLLLVQRRINVLRLDARTTTPRQSDKYCR